MSETGPATAASEQTEASETNPAVSATLKPMASGAAFQMGLVVDEFDRIEKVADYVMPVLAEDALWTAMVGAVRDIMANAELTEPLIGVIVAEEPLIGLAAATALLADPGVPLRRTDAALTRDRFAGSLAADRRLTSWRESLRKLETGTSPLLMRAWDVPHAGLAEDFRLLSRDGTTPQPRSIVCLVRAINGATDLPTVIDATRTQDILIRVIERLELPRTTMGRVRPADLIMAYSAERIIEALNSEEHHVFERLAWRHELGRRPIVSGRRDLIVGREENQPRHAACLFVAGHFPHLTPGQFAELGDALAMQTPTWLPGQNDRRPPPQVTDWVLEECGIRFVPTKRQALVAVIGADDATDDFASRAEGDKMAASICAIFENDAALLKERYLIALAMRLTLGHASEEIASHYQLMEIDALRAAAALEAEAARERLRRIVFGYAAFVRADEGYLRANRRGLEAMLRRACRRAPRMIAELSARVAGFSMADAVAALCSAEPIDTDESWSELFHHSAARLFWLTYASDPAEVTLAGYPAFVGRGGMPVEVAQRRRLAALAAMRVAFANPAQDALLEGLDQRLRDPILLTRLLYDVAREFPRLVHDESEPFAATLLGEVGCEYLLRGIRERTWRSLPPWPDDVTLARAIFSVRMGAWLDPERRYMARQDWGRLGPDAAAPNTSRSIGTTRWEEGYRGWLIAVLVLDAIVGCGSLDELELIARSIFLLDRLEAPPDNDLLDFCEFSNAGLWEWLCDPELAPRPWSSDGDHAELFRHLADRLFAMFPVLLLMASTRVPSRDGQSTVEFRFSEELRHFLTTAKDAQGAPLLAALQRDVAGGRELQARWRAAVDKWKFPQAQLGRWRAARQEREAALLAFQRALQPLSYEVRLRPASPGAGPRVAAQGGGPVTVGADGGAPAPSVAGEAANSLSSPDAPTF